MSKLRSRRRALAAGLAMVAPALVILIVFHVGALGYVCVLSLRSDAGGWSLEQYRKCFREDPLSGDAAGPFTRSLANTLWYAVGTVPVSIGLGLLIAVLLAGGVRGRTLYRMIYFLPFTTSAVAAAAAWKWIFHREEWGIVNAALVRWGGHPVAWTETSTGIFQLIARDLGHDGPLPLAGPSLALVTCMIFAVWHSVGFNIVVFLAGVGRIPRELYEAARVDGAGAWTTFWKITFPLLGPTTFFLCVVMTISSFQAMSHIFIMTPAQWDRSAQNVTLLIFEQIWQQHDYRFAAAAAALLFVIILALTLAQFHIFGRRIHYR